MSLKGFFQNSYFYLFLGCMGALGSLGITILMAEKASSEPVLAPYPGIVPSACPEQTQAQLNLCAYEWEQATDQHREEVYNNLLATLNPEQTIDLEQVELSWRIFESNYCRLLSDSYRGGTIQPLILSTCRAERDNERIEILLQWGAVDAEYEALAIELQNTYQTVLQEGSPYQQERLPLNQAFWELYQTRQCDWEAMQAEISDQQRKQCLTRLSQQRLEQLRLF
ncbi:MAG: DUF1311 domain-containing protein [Leptolyngbya sp. SIO3F4]|nr:DUF1311 domain-containing protein [Leptolyngbya sp. SIO3F4]